MLLLLNTLPEGTLLYIIYFFHSYFVVQNWIIVVIVDKF